MRGQVDERIGKPFNEDERYVVARLLSEGRNITRISERKSGGPNPDMAVDGRLSEIKTSRGTSMESFAQRLIAGAESQSRLQFVNAKNSRMLAADLAAVPNDLVAQKHLTYARIIGADFEMSFGRWEP